jgi:hypothetical protein
VLTRGCADSGEPPCRSSSGPCGSTQNATAAGTETTPHQCTTSAGMKFSTAFCSVGRNCCRMSLTERSFEVRCCLEFVFRNAANTSPEPASAGGSTLHGIAPSTSLQALVFSSLASITRRAVRNSPRIKVEQTICPGPARLGWIGLNSPNLQCYRLTLQAPSRFARGRLWQSIQSRTSRRMAHPGDIGQP